MSNDDKRFYRELKRTIKKTGNKKARKFYKKQLEDDPESVECYDYGHDQSSALNGRDGKNRKRNRLKRGELPNEGSSHQHEPGEEGPHHPA